jgi:hypothetical protein
LDHPRTEQCKSQYGVARYVAGVIDKAETDERAIFKFNADNSDTVKGLSDAQAGNLVATGNRTFRETHGWSSAGLNES